jgi:cystathionine beta-synthase
VPGKKPLKILDTILENIGHTPMVRINKITEQEGIKCELGM